MSEDERSYGAGEDIPGTPGPFPFGLLSFGLAMASAMIASVMLFAGLGVPLVLALAPAVGWLLFGLAGLMQGAWKGFLLGLPVLLAPWVALFVLIANAFAPE